MAMAEHRLSHLQRRTLAWLAAEEQRTYSTMSASPEELVHALAYDKGHLSQSLANLEAKGLITMARTPRGKAEALDLSSQSRKLVAHLAGSCE
jgi:DNA-binding MarR family transcriptional regulator